MSEEEAQQLLYQMQMLEGYLTELSQKESSLLGVIREAVSATETIKNSKIKSDTETLVPIGMGTYMKATSMKKLQERVTSTKLQKISAKSSSRS